MGGSRQGAHQPLNAGKIHVGNPLMRDVRLRFALEPPCEDDGLYGRALFSVKRLLRKKVTSYFHLLRRS